VHLVLLDVKLGIDPLRREAVMSLAGPTAEQRFAGYPRDMQDRMWESAWATDCVNARARLHKAFGAASRKCLIKINANRALKR
jgi:hypothetical protein